MSIAEWKAEMIYRNEEGLDINDISHNEDIFILTKYITTSENKMFLFDRKQDRMTEISEEPGNYSSSGFSKDDVVTICYFKLVRKKKNSICFY
jgi:hypothetical protein